MIRQNQLVTVVEHVSALRALEWTGLVFCLVNSFNSRNMTGQHGSDQTKPSGNSSRTCICFEGL